MAAGYGTRFWPVTKAVPKELLPLGNRPAMDFIVEEFVESGVDDIMVVLSKRKRLIRTYYRPASRWEQRLQQTHTQPSIEALLKSRGVRLRFVYQRTMGGTGHALLTSYRHLSASEPVVVAYPDDVHWGAPPLSSQLIALGGATDKSVLATVYNPPNPERYGIIKCDPASNAVRDIVEKPPPDKLPSRYASIGRFFYQPQFFRYLRHGWTHHRRSGSGEYYHTYALKKLIAEDGVIHHPLQGEILDMGEPAASVRSAARLQHLQSHHPSHQRRTQ